MVCFRCSWSSIDGKEERVLQRKGAAGLLRGAPLAMIEAELASGPAPVPAQSPPEAEPGFADSRPTNGHRVREIELHEVKMLNKHSGPAPRRVWLAGRGLVAPRSDRR